MRIGAIEGSKEDLHASKAVGATDSAGLIMGLTWDGESSFCGIHFRKSSRSGPFHLQLLKMKT